MSGRRNRGRDGNSLRNSRSGSNNSISLQEVDKEIFGSMQNTALRHMGIVANDDGSVTINGVRLTSRGMVFEDDLPEDEWLALLEGIEKIKRAYVWILADWLQYGIEREYGKTEDRLQKIAEITGYSVSALQDLAWLSKAIEISFRKENLSIKHHKLVAKLPAPEQDKWLQYADQNKLSASALEAAIEGFEVVDPTPYDKSLQKLHRFQKTQMRLAKKAKPHERKSIAQALRHLADEIENL